MEKVVLLCLILAMFAGGALNAQYTLDSYSSSSSTGGMPMELGFTASLGLSNISRGSKFSDGNTYNPGFSGSAGAFASMQLDEYMAVRPELIANLNTRSNIQEYYLWGTYMDRHAVLSVQVPVSLLFTPVKMEDMEAYAGGGLFLGLPVLAYWWGRDGAESVNEHLSKPLYGFQILGGARYDIAFAELRASYELNTQWKDTPPGYETHYWNVRLVMGMTMPSL